MIGCDRLQQVLRWPWLSCAYACFFCRDSLKTSRRLSKKSDLVQQNYKANLFKTEKKKNQNRKASRPKSQEMVCTQLCPGCPHWKLLPSSLVAFLRAAPPGKGGPSASSWPLFEENLISLKQPRQTDAMGCTSFTAL